MTETSRRALLTGAAGAGVAAVVAACGGGDGGAGPRGGRPTPEPRPPAAARPRPAAAGGALATTADIPVGGGKIFPGRRCDRHPADGGHVQGLRAPSAPTAVHAAAVADGTIMCACHGSGSPPRTARSTPARRPDRCPSGRSRSTASRSPWPDRADPGRRARTIGLPACQTRRPTAPPRAPIPDAPGVYRFRDETGRVIYVGKAKSLRSGSTPTSPTLDAAPAHPADGHHRRPRSTGSPSAPRSRRCSWSTPGSRSTTRGSTSATATTSRTRTSPSPSTRSIRGCR